MKRRDDATPVGGTATTARPWWQARHGDASHLPTGTIRVRAPQSAAQITAGVEHVLPRDSEEVGCGSCASCGRTRPSWTSTTHR
jgi:hypothetical protein